MAKIKNAVHQCDFCEGETENVKEYWFGQKSSSGVQGTFIFELCPTCARTSYENKNFIKEKVMSFFGIKKKVKNA